MNTKKCTTCKLPKSRTTDFPNNKSTKDGLHPQCRSCLKEYRKLKNKERVEYNKRFKEQNKLYQKMYKKLNPHISQFHNNLRRSRKLNATPDWIDLTAIKMIYKQCEDLNKTSDEKYVVDHVIPLTNEFVCGLHVHHNLQIITENENLIKGNKFPL